MNDHLAGRPVELPPPPRAPRRPSAHTVHGITRIDPWGYLDGDPWRGNAGAYLDAENAYADLARQAWGLLEEQLFEEAVALDQVTDSRPWTVGSYQYRFAPGGSGPLGRFQRRRLGSRRWRTIVDYSDEVDDPDGYAHFGSLNATVVSPDQRWVAFPVNDVGDDDHEIRLRRISTGDTWVIATGAGDQVCFGHDETEVVYGRVDRSRIASVVRWREDGERVLVRGLPSEHLWFHRSNDDTHLIIGSYRDNRRTRAWVVDLREPAAPPRRLEGFTVAVPPIGPQVIDRHPGGGGRWWAVEGRGDGRVVSFPEQPGARRRQHPVVIDRVLPTRPGTLVRGLFVRRSHLVVLEEHQFRPRLRVVPLSPVSGLPAGRGFTVTFRDTELVDIGDPANRAFGARTLLFSVESPTRPARLCRLNLDTGAVVELDASLPDGYDPSRYRARRITITADDGVEIPVLTLARRDTPRDGTAPAIVIAYGAYGDSYWPEFQPKWIPVLDRGVLVAFAGVRGGAEHGVAWHDAGRLENKERSFRDYVDVVRGLTAGGWCSPRRVVGYGRSAGGLVMGWAANNHPRLFCGIVAGVPFVDTVTSMLHPERVLVTGEWGEWGDPRKSIRTFARMLSWSPYDNVEAHWYPPMYIHSGIHDSRVPVGEPLKLAAKIRALRTDDNLLVCRVHLDEGHTAGDNRDRSLRRDCEWLAFALAAAGVDATLPRPAARRARAARTAKGRPRRPRRGRPRGDRRDAATAPVRGR